MPQQIQLRLLPAEAAQPATVYQAIAIAKGVPVADIKGYYILKQSIDARSKQPWINLTIQAFIKETPATRPLTPFVFKEVAASAKQVVIIGAGPAGLFAALKLLEAGIKPIILERGKDVRARRRDLAQLNKSGFVNPDSNYCFGEGGAGTYSDGKLYTRSHKRGDVERILQLFVHFGADERILFEAHPHIGTNKLPHIITAMRQKIIAAGGEVHFEQCVDDFIIKNNTLTAVRTTKGALFSGEAFILATGHSARDIFELLEQKKIQLEAKPFALGVRVEHPQHRIDWTQYHQPNRDPHLPPAAYSWVEQVNGKGVFSFCMCPGGIIAPAATAPGELVVNGWSPSKRNNPFANSGIVVSVEKEDIEKKYGSGALSLLRFQQSVEQNAFTAGGTNLQAPAQRLIDFCENRFSATLPVCSYVPGLQSAALQDVLPHFISDRLRIGFQQIGKKMRHYYTNEAVVVATESRTSSPVRIPRDPVSLAHPQLQQLYPCGEGAGYAGGIVSAAMDGERVAAVISNN